MFQTRSEDGTLQNFKTLQDALEAGRNDLTIWRISFEIADGTRIRLLRTNEGWTYENVMTGMRDN